LWWTIKSRERKNRVGPAKSVARTRKIKIFRSEKAVTEHFNTKVCKQGIYIDQKMQLRNCIYRKLYKLKGCKVEP
jgi:hypothetical protein